MLDRRINHVEWLLVIMFFVYLLTLPMLFVIPTHYMYGFLVLTACAFSMVSLHVKDFECAQMDVAHEIIMD